MGVSDLGDGVQPVVHEPATLAVYGGADTPTAVMSNDHDVLLLQHVDLSSSIILRSCEAANRRDRK